MLLPCLSLQLLVLGTLLPCLSLQLLILGALFFPFLYATNKWYVVYEAHSIFAAVTWNKGLTKETNETVARSSVAISIALKGKAGRKHTDVTKIIISDRRKAFLEQVVEEKDKVKAFPEQVVEEKDKVEAYPEQVVGET